MSPKNDNGKGKGKNSSDIPLSVVVQGLDITPV